MAHSYASVVGFSSWKFSISSKSVIFSASYSSLCLVSSLCSPSVLLTRACSAPTVLVAVTSGSSEPLHASISCILPSGVLCRDAGHKIILSLEEGGSRGSLNMWLRSSPLLFLISSDPLFGTAGGIIIWCGICPLLPWPAVTQHLQPLQLMWDHLFFTPSQVFLGAWKT